MFVIVAYIFLEELEALKYVVPFPFVPPKLSEEYL
jgi:hypothetical protein